jgi:hypothetical protein
MIYRKIFTISMALLLLGGCTPKKATPSNDKPDLSTPEGLAHAVFQALKKHDAQAYVMLTANTREEVKVACAWAWDNDDFELTDAELEELRELRRRFFNQFIVMVENRDIHLGEATIKEIRSLQAGSAKFDNFVLVVQDGKTELEIILDDCLLFPRGWLILDRLRLSENPESNSLDFATKRFNKTFDNTMLYVDARTNDTLYAVVIFELGSDGNVVRNIRATKATIITHTPTVARLRLSGVTIETRHPTVVTNVLNGSSSIESIETMDVDLKKTKSSEQ